ncbi:MAG: bifunctional nuclease family protein [Acidobacteriota bacterium]|nr:MAG: bifunctional nuclease family protein [Acidobacteriota bacterium]
MMVELQILGLMVDPITNMPMLVLRDPRSDAQLPMWVGAFEALAISNELERITSPRPMTHDLLHNVIGELGARVAKVVITDIQDNIFFAVLHLETPSGPRQLDSRPSDAIALALRSGAPMYANADVLRRAQDIDLARGHHGDSERIRHWLESLGTEELGKYEQ